MDEAEMRPTRRVILIGLVAAVTIAGLAVATVRRASSVPAGPPEAIVEGFVRELATHNYERALPYLTEHMLAQTIPLTLEVRINDLERRMGSLRNVRGGLRWSTETRAYAAAEADSERAGHITLGFGLARESNGAWRIDELYELGWKPKGAQ